MDKDFLLIQKMKKGNKAAMDIFVRKYYPAVYSYCRCRLSDVSYAEDLTQETFERFFRALPEYRHYGKVLNYLYVTAGNLCKDFYGIKQAALIGEPMEFQEMAERGRIERRNSEGQRDFAEKVVEKLTVKEAIEKLPQELKDAVVLYYLQELKYREIAQVLGIGVPLAKYRVRRAKELLGELLERSR